MRMSLQRPVSYSEPHYDVPMSHYSATSNHRANKYPVPDKYKK